jgi:alpha-ribazole phosphatase
MKIVLARHGDATNQEGKFHGLIDYPLTEKGRETSYEMARELEKYNPTMIFYSDMSRSKDTAKILHDELNIPMKRAPQLNPLDLGDFVGKSSSGKNLEEVRHYLNNPNEKIPGGQSVNDWAAVYLPFFEKYFQKKGDNDSIIFVTHGRNIIITKAYLHGHGLAPSFDKSVLADNKVSIEHAGHAVAEPPNKFRIIDSASVAAGKS